MTSSLCGAKCRECPNEKNCRGCAETGGKPFGGACVAAEYIRLGGIEAYDAFRETLRGEINALLTACGIPETPALYELSGGYVNLCYPLPSGESVGFLDESKVYLGCQIECGEFCFGAVADAGFILICRYGLNGSDPELICYKKR